MSQKIYYQDLTKNQLKFFLKYVFNGLGSDSFPKPPPLIFMDAAKEHDFWAWVGGTEEDRKWATKEFFHRAHDAVRKERKWKRPFYYLMSYIYYYILRKFDGLTWEYYIKKQGYLPSWLIGAEYIR